LNQEQKNSFDTLLLKKQEEFENYHKINIPVVPELNQKIVDEPIHELNELMEEMIKKRNLDFVLPPVNASSKNIKLVIDDKPLENYTNKVIDLDKRVMWDVTEITDLTPNKLTKEILNDMLEVNIKEKIQNIQIKVKELLKEIEEVYKLV